MDQRVAMVRLDRSPPVFHPSDSYRFQKNRSFHWLQKICLWVLKKLRCEEMLSHTYIEYNIVDNVRFTDAIYQQFHNMYEFNKEPGVILIGAEDFAEMTAQERTEWGFHFDHRIELGNRYSRYKVFNIPVSVIPWMRGIVVVPLSTMKKYN